MAFAVSIFFGVDIATDASDIEARTLFREFRVELCLDSTDPFRLLSDTDASPTQRIVMTTDPP